MKALIYSDLHLESQDFVPPSSDAELLILAGDIHEGLGGVKWARDHFPTQKIFYLAGNHEYYESEYHDFNSRLKEECKVYQIENLYQSETIIENTRFLGCTLWSNFELNQCKSEAIEKAESLFRDFKTISFEKTEQNIRANDMISLFNQEVSWLESKLKEPFSGKTVVITHFAPSKLSIPDSWKYLHDAFASSLESFIQSHEIDLWIHGHVHATSDYKIGNTRVICHPKGSKSHPNTEFDPSRVFEI